MLGADSVIVFDCGPDPQGKYLKVSIIPLNPTEEDIRTLVTVDDITERMRIDSVRKDFVANASHELKTPTSAIRLLAESAVDAATHDDTEQAVIFAHQIADESARLGNLVRDLLDLSRLETVAAAAGTTDMRAAVENTMLGHRNAAGDAGLAFEFEDETPGLDAYVQADPTDVAVALDNLVDNAVKYTEEGSVRLSLSVADDVVTVSIADTGVGIPPEDLPRIFERFYRVDRARSRDSGGTGLGLSLVRHVVERNDGSIEVSSEPGVGSTFRVALPRATRKG
jgi:signal transduction histidine kinase